MRHIGLSWVETRTAFHYFVAQNDEGRRCVSNVADARGGRESYNATCSRKLITLPRRAERAANSISREA